MWREFAESSRPSDMGLGNTYVLARDSLALVSVPYSKAFAFLGSPYTISD